MNGQLMILDLSECDEGLVKSKNALKDFFKELCSLIKMKPYGKPLIKRFGKDDLEGYTGVQLIETSNMTVHMDEFENKVFVDIFSCKNFDSKKVRSFSKKFFKSKKSKCRIILRK